MAIRIASLNVNGLRDSNKRMGLLHWVSHYELDILCLQETHILSSDEGTRWFSSHGFSSISSRGSNHSCGTVILFRSRLSLTSSFSDSNGRLVSCEFSYHDSKFRVVAIYAPNSNPARNTFFDYVISVVDPHVPTFVCGDFNAVSDRSLDRRGPAPLDTSRDSSLALSGLFKQCCVIDIWRYLHPTTSAFTWFKPDGSILSRIDLICVPFSWISSISSCEIVPCPFSDHSLVLLNSSIPFIIPKGPGRWLLNKSLLLDASFSHEVKDFWTSWRTRKSSYPSLLEWWDTGKMKIKGIAVTHGASKKRSASSSRTLLSNLATHLKDRLDQGLSSCFEAYQSTLSSLASFDAAEAEAARVRARVKWAEEGETSSSYFFRLEKKNGATSWCSAVRDSNDLIVSDMEGILNVWFSFYSELFTASPTDTVSRDQLFENLDLSLSHDQALICEGPLSVDEVFTALQGMARQKTPGSDGLPAEFYLTFWDVLGSDLVEVLNASLGEGSLPPSLRKSLITLIFKKGDRLNCKNWRPISLLNVDYKLCARALAGRLLKVIHLVVHPDQTCGVPGRFIGENVALLRDLVGITTERGIPAAILSLDQEKAFDRVDWSFMFSTLQRMGFGSSFIRWVRLLYTNVRCSVLVNGYASSIFFPSRGVRQGCPLSPLLFVLCIEVLAASLRANPSIVPLRLPNLSSSLPVVSLYADDTSAIVCSDEGIKVVFDTFTVYERASGSKLNLGKCKGLWLGPWRNRPDTPVPIDWSCSIIKVLAVFIGFGDLDSANWRPRLDAVSGCLQSWRSRHLSLGGKALVLNALALSRIWYVASLVHMPVWVLRELNSLIFDFFWSGKKDLVRRDVVILPRGSGGYSLVSVHLKVNALLAQWVRRFTDSPGSWVSLLTFWFFDRFGVGPLSVFSAPFSFCPDHLPPFHRALLLAWRDLGGFGDPSTFGLSISGNINASALTCKSAYLRLISIYTTVPHCASKFRPIYGDLYWPSTWSQIFFMPLDRAASDLSWKVAHGVLYTSERLSSFGYAIHTVCFCGFPLESSDHLFFYCPLAKSGIDWIQSLLSRAVLDAPSLSIRHLLFGFSPNELVTVPRIFVYLLLVLKLSIWSQRNDFRFRAVRPSALGVIAMCKARVRFYLPLYCKRFSSPSRRRYFFRQWCASGVISSITDGSLTFNF